MSLLQTTLDYFHGDNRLEGYLAFDDSQVFPRPAVLVFHDWSGRNAFACQQADWFAQLGYVGVAVDLYGDARTGGTTEEKRALMQSVANDRRFLRERIQLTFQTVAALEQVDPARIAAIGFCFGGLCVLDLARSGAAIRGAVSVHGLLDKPAELDNQRIQSKILVLHGYDDPMVTPHQVNVFCQEMTDAQVDWQVHMYGLTKHAFTNPEANDVSMGLAFNPVASKRAFQSISNFLQDIL